MDPWIIEKEIRLGPAMNGFSVKNGIIPLEK